MLPRGVQHGDRVGGAVGRTPVVDPRRRLLALCVKRAHICPDGRLNIGQRLAGHDRLQRGRHLVRLASTAARQRRNGQKRREDEGADSTHAPVRSNFYTSLNSRVSPLTWIVSPSRSSCRPDTFWLLTVPLAPIDVLVKPSPFRAM